MLLLRWLLNTLILLIVANIVPGVGFASFWAALIASVVIGLLNALVRPIIIILTLPINILTLGLFTFVINAVVFLIASSIVKGFEISSFGAALSAAIVYWLLTMLVGLIERKNEE
ncbi:MAG: phage holin family protein [bacterium]